MLKTVFGLLGWLGTALVLAAVAIRFLRPAWQPAGYWLAVAGLVCVLLYLLGQWREFARLFGRRQARYGALAMTSVVLVLGILAAINYLGSRHSKRWDLTAGQQFTLSDQTRRVLRELPEPVKAIVFAREDDFGRFRNRLTEYEHATDRLSVEYVDVDKNPARARQYEIQSYGTVVFEYQGRIERVVSDAEQELTNALIKAVEGTEPVVYFVQGHGEKDPNSAEREGYNAVREALGGDNYQVETLVLAQQADVPENASVLVVAGPRTDFLPTEIEALKRYLNKGGKLLLLLDPPDRADAAPLASLIALAREWGIDVGNDVVVDVSGIGQLLGTDASVPVAATYPSHAITERFNVLTAYPLARSVSPVSGGADGRLAQTFVETSRQSWAETDVRALMASGQVSLDEKAGDRPGPVSIAAAVSVTAPEAEQADGTPAADDEPAGEQEAAAEDDPAKDEAEEADAPKRETRVAVIGDSDFAANFAAGIQGNRDLFLNTVSWLAQQESLIAIRPREPEDRRITLTADQQQRILWISLVMIPGLVLGTGVYTWWRRR